MQTVLIAHDDLSKSYAGTARTVYEQIKYFTQSGWHVHVAMVKGKTTNIEKKGATAHKKKHWPWIHKSKKRLAFSNYAQTIAAKIKADLVIGHGVLQTQDVLCLHNCVHLMSEKITGQPLSNADPTYALHTALLKEKNFQHLIANSNLMKTDLMARFNIPENKITVIYPAVNTKQFTEPTPELIHAKRVELNIKENEHLVGLITSGDFKKRGVDRLLSAINQLPNSIAQKTHFIIIGKDRLDEKCTEKLQKSPYKERIQLLPVAQNIQAYFYALDLFVLPARIEEFGRVVAEAMMCGCPIITTQWVGASELMQGASRDFVYDGEDSAQLASLMQRILNDSALKQTLKALNIKAAQSITEEHIFTHFEKVFKPWA